jgi:hypothetical protein
LHLYNSDDMIRYDDDDDDEDNNKEIYYNYSDKDAVD